MNQPNSLIERIKAMPKEQKLLSLDPKIPFVGGMLMNFGRDLTIEANGSRITQGLKIHGGGEIIINNARLPTAPAYGLMILECKAFRSKNTEARGAGVTGLLLANTSNILVENCEFSDSVQQHGIYVSQSCDDVQLHFNRCNRNGRAGIQVNAVQHPMGKDPRHDSISQKVGISGNYLEGNQKGSGAAAIQLSSCRDVTIYSNTIKDHYGRNGIALWDDGTNRPELACQGVKIDLNKFDFNPSAKVEFIINVGAHSKDILIGENNVFPTGLKVHNMKG